MSTDPPPFPHVDVRRFARATVARIPEASTAYQYAIVSRAPYAAATGESVIDVTVGDSGDLLTYPIIRYAAGMAPVVADKVLLLWLGTDPVAILKLAP